VNKGPGAKIESGYRKLNSMGSKKPMSVDEWMSLILPLIALSVSSLTGIRDAVAIPASLFASFTIYTLIRYRSDWPKRLAVAAGGCVLLYVILIFHHQQSQFRPKTDRLLT